VLRFFTGFVGPRAKVLGTEFAGVVESVGPHVSTFAAGDRVFGYLEGTFGAHAEYLVVASSASVAHVPAGVSFASAAASTEGMHYAIVNLRAAKIRPSHEVLINGATGAIGSAAAQLASAMGARVSVVTRGETVGLIRDMGVDRVINSDVSDFSAAPDRYDVVFDAVGKSSFGRCRKVLKRHGIFLSTDLGPFPWNPLLALTTRFRTGPRVLFPLPKHDQAMIEEIAGWLGSGVFRPLIDRTFPLADIAAAYTYVETGQKLGNVVILVGQD